MATANSARAETSQSGYPGAAQDGPTDPQGLGDWVKSQCGIWHKLTTQATSFEIAKKASDEVVNLIF